jgi:hypothetical protein
MFLRYRHRRWIALFALMALLFQQLAMASYLCPQEQSSRSVAVEAVAPCHASKLVETPLCHEHCYPTAASPDHTPVVNIAAALLPVTVWVRECAGSTGNRMQALAVLIDRVHPPPLTIRHCSFQI